jgi:hypothetical protein
MHPEYARDAQAQARIRKVLPAEDIERMASAC